MTNLKQIIRQLTPPIIISHYRRLKKKKYPIPFSGVYNSFYEIHNENPWIQEPWIELSKNKLRRTREISRDSFLPTSDFKGYAVLPCLIANLLSQRNPCNVLDYGGGTGYIYFHIYPYLLRPENVKYYVVDMNLELLRIGKKHAKSIGNEDGIVFTKEMPKKGDLRLDLLYFNTVMQYIPDYSSLLVTLLQYKPQYVILTRLIAGEAPTYITCQNMLGYTTPCIFINLKEIIDIFTNNGLNLIFKSPNAEEVMVEAYDKNIPEHLRIHNTANLIFKRCD